MREEKHPAVYIIANKRNGTIYLGVTSALWNRISTHKSKSLPGFSSKYGITLLVWYEHHQTMETAIRRERGNPDFQRVTYPSDFFTVIICCLRRLKCNHIFYVFTSLVAFYFPTPAVRPHTRNSKSSQKPRYIFPKRFRIFDYKDIKTTEICPLTFVTRTGPLRKQHG